MLQKQSWEVEVLPFFYFAFNQVFNLFQVPWFCGHFRRCWDPPGNRWALEQAKFNLANKYFLVGLTEDLETFIDLMEMSLPRFFKVHFFILFQLLFLFQTSYDQMGLKQGNLLKGTVIWTVRRQRLVAIRRVFVYILFSVTSFL